MAIEIARITSNGQRTVPKSVREHLHLDAGSQVVFPQVGDDWIIRNVESLSVPHAGSERSTATPSLFRLTPESLPALRKVQEAFVGEAERLELHDETDVAELMASARRGEIE